MAPHALSAVSARQPHTAEDPHLLEVQASAAHEESSPNPAAPPDAPPRAAHADDRPAAGHVRTAQLEPPSQPPPKSRATILVIDDDQAMHPVFSRLLSDETMDVVVASSPEQGVRLFAERRPDVVLLDIMLPGESGLDTFARLRAHDPQPPVIFITSDQNSETAIEAMSLGAYDYLVKPLDFPRVRKLVATAVDIRRLTQQKQPLAPDDSDEQPLDADLMVGRCAAMQEVYKQIGRVASQNVTTLIYGESGTGKELVARAIYQHSERADGPFLAVNCAAIPEPLLESELFGHEKGGFTGADRQRIGKFEQCSGGTLFLDEIGDMTPLVQSKVLRVLQEQRFERVGGNQTIATDVRIIAATNRNLEQMVAEGHFRPDLFYRLTGFTIALPPLRERGEDIELLVRHLLHRASYQLGKTVAEIAPETIERLKAYHWPGNIRELQNVVRQAVLRSTGPVLLPQFLPPEIGAAKGLSAEEEITAGQTEPATGQLDEFMDRQLREGSTSLYSDAVEHLERRLLSRVLEHTGGNQSHASRILGITRGSLRKKIRHLGITLDCVVHLRAGEAQAADPHDDAPGEANDV